MEAQLRDAQSGLDDTYYNHSMDQRQTALDDEQTSFEEIKNRFIETLRETLEDTEAVINEKISEVLMNADVVLETVDNIAAERGVTLTDSLRTPWIEASKNATEFKATATADILSLINEDGIITLFGTDATDKLVNTFGAGSTAANNFASDVNTVILAIQAIVDAASSPMTEDLAFPWNDLTKDDGPISTFSNDVFMAITDAVTTAKNNAIDMTTNLTSPWTAATNAVNTFSTTAENALNKVLEKHRATVAEIESSKVVKVPNYTGNGASSGGGNGGDSGNATTTLTGATNQVWEASRKKANALKAAQDYVDKMNWTEAMGKFGIGQKDFQFQKLLKNLIDAGGSINELKWALFYEDPNKKGNGGTSRSTFVSISNAQRRQNVMSAFAKGTTGTKKDQWAITDESWIGEEITLAAGKSGQLQYLKKGSAVMPASISENLVEWGKMNPFDMMSKTIMQPNVANIATNNTNAVQVHFDTLIKTDFVSKDVLPEVEQMVSKQLTQFTRELNYSLKRFK